MVRLVIVSDELEVNTPKLKDAPDAVAVTRSIRIATAPSWLIAMDTLPPPVLSTLRSLSTALLAVVTIADEASYSSRADRTLEDGHALTAAHNTDVGLHNQPVASVVRIRKNRILPGPSFIRYGLPAPGFPLSTISLIIYACRSGPRSQNFYLVTRCNHIGADTDVCIRCHRRD